MLVDAFRTHGRLLRALADEATHDDEVVAAGKSTLSDPEEVATALVWMNERFLQQRFGRPPVGDPERAAAALAEIWIRTVYR